MSNTINTTNYNSNSNSANMSTKSPSPPNPPLYNGPNIATNTDTNISTQTNTYSNTHNTNNMTYTYIPFTTTDPTTTTTTISGHNYDPKSYATTSVRPPMKVASTIPHTYVTNETGSFAAHPDTYPSFSLQNTTVSSTATGTGTGKASPSPPLYSNPLLQQPTLHNTTTAHNIPHNIPQNFPPLYNVTSRRPKQGEGIGTGIGIRKTQSDSDFTKLSHLPPSTSGSHSHSTHNSNNTHSNNIIYEYNTTCISIQTLDDCKDESNIQIFYIIPVLCINHIKEHLSKLSKENTHVTTTSTNNQADLNIPKNTDLNVPKFVEDSRCILNLSILEDILYRASILTVEDK